MTRYHCPKCKVDFFKEHVNINQRHHCGEFAHVEWGAKYEGIPDGESAPVD